MAHAHDTPTAPQGHAAARLVQVPRDGERLVGPVALLVHVRAGALGPGELPVDTDVRAHPHLGLVAISYVLRGHMTHRDSLGHHAELGPGDVGLLVSGTGAVHSERFERLRLLGGELELFQILAAMPDGQEGGSPSFEVRGRAGWSEDEGGARVRWVVDPRRDAGLLIVSAALDDEGSWAVPSAPERALYVVEGDVEVSGVSARAGQVVRDLDVDARVVARGGAHVLVFGGAPVGPRHFWWNYLHASRAEIERHREAWRRGEVALPPGDTESFTPAPADDGRPWIRLNGA